MRRTTSCVWSFIVLIAYQYGSTHGAHVGRLLSCCFGGGGKRKCNVSCGNVTDTTSSNDGTRLLASSLIQISAPLSPKSSLSLSPKNVLHKLKQAIPLVSQRRDNHWDETVNYDRSYIDCILGNINPLISSPKLQIANEFARRQNETAFEMNHKTKLQLSPHALHASNSSILVALNGRHTIFDSVPDNHETMEMLQRYDAKSKDKLLVFKSLHYPHTLNVIRTGIMQFISKLVEISTRRSSMLCMTLYINKHNITPQEQAEIISVMTFIEMYYNRNLLHHQKENKVFQFQLLLIEHHPLKTLQRLSNRIPLHQYRKLILIDHEGLVSWDFGKWRDDRIRICHEEILKRLQDQIVPIQPLEFKVHSQNATDDFFLRMTAMIGDDIDSRAFSNKFKADFSTHWLKFERENIITVWSKEFDISHTLSFSANDVELMDASQIRRKSNPMELKMNVELCLTMQSMKRRQELSQSTRDADGPLSPLKLHTGAKWRPQTKKKSK